MKKIAIIGAGISGLFLANLLEQDKSYQYKIFEKKKNLDFSDGYGIQLSVNSISLLNKIGFKKINVNNVYFPRKVNFFNANNMDKICDVDLKQFNSQNNRYTTLKRSTLIKLLSDNIPKEKLVFNSDLVDVDTKDDFVLKFKNNESNKFNYLVAADGIFSVTKQLILNNSEPKFFNSVAIRGNLNNYKNSDISLCLGPNFHFVIYPINQNNEFNFVSIIRKKLSKNELVNKSLFENVSFMKNLLNIIYLKSNINLEKNLHDIKCFPIFISKNIQIPKLKNFFLIGDAFYSFPPSFAQGASQSIESAFELFEDLKNNSKNFYKKRVYKINQIKSRSSINHFAFHLSNPLIIIFRNILLKYFSKNKKFLENYLGKIYNN